MTYLIIDPSLACTGWAIIEDAPQLESNCRMIAAGSTKADKGTACERAHQIAIEIFQEIQKEKIESFDTIIETPMTFCVGRGPRSASTLPNYGIVVGTIWMYFKLQGKGKVHEVSASKWAISSKVKGDKDKTMRVMAVEQKFNLKPGSLGCKTDAGNVADAVLLGVWWINKLRLEAAGGTDAGCDTVGRSKRKAVRKRRNAPGKRVVVGSEG